MEMQAGTGIEKKGHAQGITENRVTANKYHSFQCQNANDHNGHILTKEIN
jgi:hypothetical protein